MKRIRVLSIFLFSLFSLLFTQVYAEEKIWNAGGDAFSWSDADNWSAAGAPTATSDVLLDAENAAVVCTGTFSAKSITLGGKQNPSLTSDNFVSGTISPDSSSDIAILNRRGGTFTLKGAGTITLQGHYQDSEESLAPEPSFMFWVE